MKIARIATVVALLVVLLVAYKKRSELYRPLSAAHRLGFIDTNPARRVSDAFDQCSPENWEDCRKKAKA